MGRQWLFGNGNGLTKDRGEHTKPDDVLASVWLPTAPMGTYVFWYPRSQGSKVLANSLIAALVAIRPEWESFLKMYVRKPRQKEVAIFCDGLQHAESKGFHETWDFTRDAVCSTSTPGKHDSLIISTVITENYEDFDQAHVTTATLGLIAGHILQRAGRLKNPQKAILRFCQSVHPEIEKNMY